MSCLSRSWRTGILVTSSTSRSRPRPSRRRRALELVGVLGVELFHLSNGELVVNELAPRPHNSGHYTFDACVTSQFEQQLRAVCGLPLGAPTQMRPAAMVNLLGELWLAGEPDWAG